MKTSLMLEGVLVLCNVNSFAQRFMGDNLIEILRSMRQKQNWLMYFDKEGYIKRYKIGP